MLKSTKDTSIPRLGNHSVSGTWMDYCMKITSLRISYCGDFTVSNKFESMNMIRSSTVTVDWAESANRRRRSIICTLLTAPQDSTT